jgi:hypothetical protein
MQSGPGNVAQSGAGAQSVGALVVNYLGLVLGSRACVSGPEISETP